jgi:hypothetical protein
MNKIIRSECFESNSSSTHSISINTGSFYADNDDYKQLYGDKIELTGGEFGWEVESYNDFITKANYCAQDQWSGDVSEEIVLPKDAPKSNIQILKEVIEEVTGLPVEFDAISLDTGYVDHQSQGTTGVLFLNKEDLKSFLFNDKSVLYTDNDNH